MAGEARHAVNPRDSLAGRLVVLRLVLAAVFSLLALGCDGPDAADTGSPTSTAQQPDSGSSAAAAPADVALAFDPFNGRWVFVQSSGLPTGSEVLQDGHLLRLGADGWELVGPVTPDALYEADQAFNPRQEHHPPGWTDWVWMMRDLPDAGHRQLRNLVPGDRFAWQGRIYETRAGPGGELGAVRPTGAVVSRVAETFTRFNRPVLAVDVRGDDGRLQTLTGTAEHPFYMEQDRDWIGLEDLKVGDRLLTSAGGSSVVEASPREVGTAQTFNFAVERTHNYFVSGDRDGAPGTAVLVHNTSPCELARAAVEQGTETTAEVVKVLQSGGRTLKTATLRDLGLSKDQGKRAIEGLKYYMGLRNDTHGQILSDGSLRVDGEVVGNLYDHVP